MHPKSRGREQKLIVDVKRKDDKSHSVKPLSKKSPSKSKKRKSDDVDVADKDGKVNSKEESKGKEVKPNDNQLLHQDDKEEEVKSVRDEKPEQAPEQSADRSVPSFSNFKPLDAKMSK